MSGDQPSQSGRIVALVLIVCSALLAIVALTSESTQTMSGLMSFSFRAGQTIMEEEDTATIEDDDEVGEFKIYSTAFKTGDRLPDAYTCLSSDDEGGVSPPIGWKNPPLAAVQFVLFMNSHCSSNADRYRYEVRYLLLTTFTFICFHQYF
jgi:hypothetical protein